MSPAHYHNISLESHPSTAKTECCVQPALVDLLETTIAHVLPGTLFLIYGVWWAILSSWNGTDKSLKQQFKHRAKKGEDNEENWHYRSWLPQIACCKIPLEPLVKTFVPLIGIIEECLDVGRDELTSRTYLKMYSVTNPDGSFNDLSQLQHITMYSAFIISGVWLTSRLCLLLSYPGTQARYSLPLHSWSKEPCSTSTHWDKLH